MPIREFCIALFAAFALACAVPVHAQSTYGIGRAAAPAEIAGWNIDVDRYGNNLPPGSGSVSHGHDIFDQQCAACHGAKGEGGVGDQLVGGQGTLATAKPVRTVGSYWPYAPTLFDYIRRAMPQNAPQSLSNDDLCCFGLHSQFKWATSPWRNAGRENASPGEDAEQWHVRQRSTARR